MKAPISAFRQALRGGCSRTPCSSCTAAAWACAYTLTALRSMAWHSVWHSASQNCMQPGHQPRMQKFKCAFGWLDTGLRQVKSWALQNCTHPGRH